MEDGRDILKQIELLATSRVNDAVRLAFLTGEDLGLIDKLDLTAVTEFKRNKDGGVELKFLDRLGALEWLMEHSGGDPLAEQYRRALETGASDVWGGAG